MMLEIKNVSKAFGRRQAVDDVSLSIREGEIFGVLGPNGAGKSTTISLISGLRKTDSGSIKINGYEISKNPAEAKRLIGVVPQEIALYQTLSASANLRFWGEMNNLSGKELQQAVKRVLDMVGLSERADEKVSKFSGGMKRRLNIAAGMIHNPRLLILDEPTVGIDPQSRNHILETIKRLKDGNTTIIYTSHYVEEVEYLCDRVAIMDKGRIIKSGSVEQLLSQGDEFQELIIRMNSFSDNIFDSLQALPGVTRTIAADEALSIITANAEKVLPLAFAEIIGQGASISEIKINKPNLESLFLKLTGRALRD